MKKLFVNGCSFSRGPGSWPYHLQNNINYQLTNHAVAGAGNTYIRQTTINQLLNNSYDLVIIMWSGLERIDIQVDDINKFDTPYTSFYQSQQNDWPEKIVSPINDQDSVQKDWVLGCGFVNNDTFLKNTDMFKGLYKHQGLKQHVMRSITDMICLQGFLHDYKVPYIFTFYQNYLELLKQEAPKHFEFLKLSNTFNDPNLYDITKKHQWFADDGLHPSIIAHQHWAKDLTNWMYQNNYV